MDKDLQALQDVRDCLRRAKEAGRVLGRMSQAEVDRIARAMCMAGSRAATELAKLAVEETGMGRVESKIAKNRVATDLLWQDIKGIATVGVIERDEARRVLTIAEPMGIVAAVIPTTNPTSTALYKCIISLKARNPIVVSPHPRAVRCIAEACRIVSEAAERAGAPARSVQCLTNVTLGATQALMGHRLTGVVLATGGPDLVKAAYSSGNPALGVGPGNPPAIVHPSADLDLAARMLVASQTFDNGTICASEQSIVCFASVKEPLLQALARHGCHLCSPDEVKKLEKVVLRGKRQNADIVGQYPWKIAEMAGFRVPRETTVLIAEYRGVGFDRPLSIEKLSPILTFYTVHDLEGAIQQADELLRFGGDGHTLAIHATDEEIVLQIASRLPASRVMINAPTSQGSVGFATNLVPSLTLGCGTLGKNISSNNISPRDLINRKRVAWVKEEITDPAFDADAYFQKVREGYGFGQALIGQEAPGPIRPYLHAKVCPGAAKTAPPAVAAARAVSPQPAAAAPPAPAVGSASGPGAGKAPEAIAELSLGDVKKILERSFR